MKHITNIKHLLNKVLLLVGLGLMMVKTIYAQQYFFQNFNTENGLIQSQTNCLAQDKFNRLWIGTWGGLSIFDGSYFKNYTRANGLISNSVTSVDFLHDGSAWIGTTEGISYFDGLKFSNYTLSSHPDSNWISSINVDNRSRIWALSRNKLFVYSKGGFQIQSQLYEDIIVALFKDNSGVIHVAYLRNGIYKFENDQWRQVLPAPKGFLLSARYSIKGELVGIGTEGVFKIQSGNLEYLLAKTSQIDFQNNAFKIAVDNSNNIWLTSLKGVWLLKNGQLHALNFTNGFTDEQTLDVLIDRYNNLWIATNGSGLYKYAESPFTKFDNKIIPNAKSILSIFKSKDQLILGSTLQGIYNFNPNSVVATKSSYQGLPTVLTSIYQDENAGLIASYFNQTFQWKNGKRNDIKAGISNAIPSSWKTIADSVWGISSKGLFKLNGENLELIQSGNNFTELAADAKYNIILSFKGGIAVFDRLRRTLDTIPQMKGMRIHCMVTDEKRWYLGTDDRGILIYDLNTQTYQGIDQRNGLSCNYIYNLLKDKAGNIWAGTGCGIDKLRIDQDGHFELKSYGKSDGLNGAESNAKASFQDEEGLIWFGTTKGLFRYDGQKEKQVKIVPFVSLVDLKLFSKDIDANKLSDSIIPFLNLPYKPVFKYDENSLSFTFRAICLSAPEKIIYKYKLIGVDKDFIETKQQIASYNQLAPGQYTFVVYASDEDGNWHENAFKYEFTIDAIFYQTFWFKTLIGLILAGVITFIIFKYSRAKEAQRQRELKLREDEQNKVRQRTAEDFHDEIGNKITRINLLTMMAEKKAGDNENMQSILKQIRQNTQSLYYGTKDIIWALQKESNYLKEALLRIQQNSIALLNETGIHLQIEEEPPIVNDVLMPMDYGRNLILIFKEAVNNAMKYSGATRLTLRFYEDIDSGIVLELEDNGHGFDVDEQNKGNGLKNMRNRAKAIKGNFSVHSLIGIGTLVRLRLFNYSFEE